MTDVDGELNLATPQLEVELDRQKMRELGLRSTRSGARSRPSSRGRTVTRFNRNAEQYDVIVQVADVDRRNAGRPVVDLCPRPRRRDGPALATW